MTLADTSAWVEYLRGTGSDTHAALRELLLADELATTEPVVMELAGGARTATQRESISRLLGRCSMLAVGDVSTYELGADVYRGCRRAGVTPGFFDCLIAAVAIRTATPLIHADRDFDSIARLTPLRLHRGEV